MKELRKYIIAMFIVALFAGCNKTELAPLTIAFNLQSDDMIAAFNTTNGEKIDFSLKLDKEKSTSGLSINQIEVFMNNIKIAEVYNKESIDVSYTLKKKTIGKNPLRITLKASASGYRETITHLNMNVNVMESKPVYGFDILSDDLWINGGEKKITVKEVDNASLSLTVNSVIYLLDDIIIGSSNGIEPTTYIVKELNPGPYVLSAIINCTTPDGQVTTNISTSKQITVQ